MSVSKNLKKLTAFLMAILLLLSLAACQPKDSTSEQQNKQDAQTDDTTKTSGEKLQIGVTVLDLANPFYVDLIDGMKKEAGDQAELTVVDCKNTADQQVTQIDNFTSAQVDGMIILAVDPVAVLPSVKKAREQGIKIVTFTTKLEEYDAHVMADEWEMGYTLGVQAGQWIRDKLNGEAKVGILNYRIIPQVINREQGIEDGIKEFAPKAEVVARAHAGSPEEGMEAAESFLQAHPDMKVICGINDGGASGAYEAVKAAGKDSDDFFIGGIDANAEALAKMKEPNSIYRATVDQDPYNSGKKTMELLLKAIRGEEHEKDYMIELVPVNADNIDQYPKKKD